MSNVNKLNYHVATRTVASLGSATKKDKKQDLNTSTTYFNTPADINTAVLAAAVKFRNIIAFFLGKLICQPLATIRGLIWQARDESRTQSGTEMLRLFEIMSKNIDNAECSSGIKQLGSFMQQYKVAEGETIAVPTTIELRTRPNNKQQLYFIESHASTISSNGDQLKVKTADSPLNSIGYIKKEIAVGASMSAEEYQVFSTNLRLLKPATDLSISANNSSTHPPVILANVANDAAKLSKLEGLQESQESQEVQELKSQESQEVQELQKSQKSLPQTYKEEKKHEEAERLVIESNLIRSADVKPRLTDLSNKKVRRIDEVKQHLATDDIIKASKMQREQQFSTAIAYIEPLFELPLLFSSFRGQDIITSARPDKILSGAKNVNNSDARHFPANGVLKRKIADSALYGSGAKGLNTSSSPKCFYTLKNKARAFWQRYGESQRGLYGKSFYVPSSAIAARATIINHDPLAAGMPSDFNTSFNDKYFFIDAYNEHSFAVCLAEIAKEYLAEQENFEKFKTTMSNKIKRHSSLCKNSRELLANKVDYRAELDNAAEFDALSPEAQQWLIALYAVYEYETSTTGMALEVQVHGPVRFADADIGLIVFDAGEVCGVFASDDDLERVNKGRAFFANCKFKHKLRVIGEKRDIAVLNEQHQLNLPVFDANEIKSLVKFS